MFKDEYLLRSKLQTAQSLFARYLRPFIAAVTTFFADLPLGIFGGRSYHLPLTLQVVLGALIIVTNGPVDINGSFELYDVFSGFLRKIFGCCCQAEHALSEDKAKQSQLIDWLATEIMRFKQLRAGQRKQVINLMADVVNNNRPDRYFLMLLTLGKPAIVNHVDINQIDSWATQVIKARNAQQLRLYVPPRSLQKISQVIRTALILLGIGFTVEGISGFVIEAAMVSSRLWIMLLVGGLSLYSLAGLGVQSSRGVYGGFYDTIADYVNSWVAWCMGKDYLRDRSLEEVDHPWLNLLLLVLIAIILPSFSPTTGVYLLLTYLIESQKGDEPFLNLGKSFEAPILLIGWLGIFTLNSNYCAWASSYIIYLVKLFMAKICSGSWSEYWQESIRFAALVGALESQVKSLSTVPANIFVNQVLTALPGPVCSEFEQPSELDMDSN